MHSQPSSSKSGSMFREERRVNATIFGGDRALLARNGRRPTCKEVRVSVAQTIVYHCNAITKSLIAIVIMQLWSQTLTNLNTHQNTSKCNPDAKKHSCERCGQKFGRKDYLEKHLQRIKACKKNKLSQNCGVVRRCSMGRNPWKVYSGRKT